MADAAGELTTYTYDLAGNRTGGQPSSGPSQSYAWDAAGQMTVSEVEAGLTRGLALARIGLLSILHPVAFAADVRHRRAAQQSVQRRHYRAAAVPAKNRQLSDG